MEGRTIITFVVFGVVALLVMGALGSGSGSYLYLLENQNNTQCLAYPCTGAANTSSAPSVILMAGTIIPIIWFVAVVLKLI